MEGGSISETMLTYILLWLLRAIAAKSMIIHLHPPPIVILRPLCSNTFGRFLLSAGQCNRRRGTFWKGPMKHPCSSDSSTIALCSTTIVISLSCLPLPGEMTECDRNATDQEVLLKVIYICYTNLLNAAYCNSVQRLHVSQESS